MCKALAWSRMLTTPGQRQDVQYQRGLRLVLRPPAGTVRCAARPPIPLVPGRQSYRRSVVRKADLRQPSVLPRTLAEEVSGLTQTGHLGKPASTLLDYWCVKSA